MPFPDSLRAVCARIAGKARSVRILEPAIADYARTLPANAAPAGDPGEHREPERQAITDGPGEPERRAISDERAAAFSLQLNAINFGSGWFPTLRKPAGRSGFRTIEAALRARGPWSAAELTGLDVATVARTFGQDRDHPLMELYTKALRELLSHIGNDGRFLALARSGNGSAVALAQRLAELPGWRDRSHYDGEAVPFFKRAQIAAADLHLQAIAPARDLAALTAFADNLVPHVLRIDGVLEFDPGLVARIDRGELLEHGSPEEVEIRACAVHAVELLVAAHGATTATAVDQALWTRGAAVRYKSHPRHRARTTAY